MTKGIQVVMMILLQLVLEFRRTIEDDSNELYYVQVPFIIVEQPLEGLDAFIAELDEKQWQNQRQEIIEEGQTAGQIVLERIMAYPELGKGDSIVLRNIGGQTVNLTGWTIQNTLQPILYEFGQPGCEQQALLAPMDSVQIVRMTKQNPCGFVIGLSFSDAVKVFDENQSVVAEMSWESSKQGFALHLIESRYVSIQESVDVIEVIKQIEDFSSFRRALSVSGLDKLLTAETNAQYKHPTEPSPPSPVYIPQFPWWFGFEVNRSMVPPPPFPPPPPPPPPFGQIPDLGPYTIFAPTNEAFADLQVKLSGGQGKVPLKKIFQLPEAKDILLYHIYYGMYTTSAMYNNIGIPSVLGPQIQVYKNPRQTEGQIGLNDACVDKPTTGFTCKQQLEFNKCYDPQMLSTALSSWRGGFCEKTCQRCTCQEEDGGDCAKIVIPDVIARNGVIQGIDRVLFPPPLFGEEYDGEERPPDEEELDQEAEFKYGLFEDAVEKLKHLENP